MAFKSLSAKSQPELDWSFSLILAISYVGLFRLWNDAPRLWVIASGLAGTAFLVLLLVRAARHGYFLNRWDLVWHASVILDLLAEALLIRFHQGRAFYLCALAFGLLIGLYRWYHWRRATSFRTEGC